MRAGWPASETEIRRSSRPSVRIRRALGWRFRLASAVGFSVPSLPPAQHAEGHAHQQVLADQIEEDQHRDDEDDAGGANLRPLDAGGAGAAEILTGSVLAWVVVRIEAKANSFQAKMKQKPAVAAMPPLTIGSTSG